MKKSLIVALIFILSIGLVGCSNEINKELKQELINKSEKIVDQLQDELDKQIEKRINEASSEVKEYQKAYAERVVDGDTIIVKFENSEKKERVRFIGVDTPESVGEYKNNPEYFGKEASEFTKQYLEGRTVYLESDVGDRDKYGRLLRYVWLGKPNKLQLKEKMFNAILIKEGYGKTATIQPNVRYQKIFLMLERQARKESKGLWRKNLN